MQKRLTTQISFSFSIIEEYSTLKEMVGQIMSERLSIVIDVLPDVLQIDIPQYGVAHLRETKIIPLYIAMRTGGRVI